MFHFQKCITNVYRNTQFVIHVSRVKRAIEGRPSLAPVPSRETFQLVTVLTAREAEDAAGDQQTNGRCCYGHLELLLSRLPKPKLSESSCSRAFMIFALPPRMPAPSRSSPPSYVFWDHSKF